MNKFNKYCYDKMKPCGYTLRYDTHNLLCQLRVVILKELKIYKFVKWISVYFKVEKEK